MVVMARKSRRTLSEAKPTMKPKKAATAMAIGRASQNEPPSVVNRAAV